ncbi:Murein DD-endopeptidase MepM and murein hydrolase activator NlpD, contain LysM domain [Desulfonauticus submarinus]|uniref:Murein DD-endopeptidase MepM and murein hydrolase activator NlpD, contain LysM domain n=1 Tax=Desulfonauticus submarinus TaxID=206665 RepID=A0A1H0DKA1_9BACT|nr:peptidoglycan DD-metalloendopeptidase family protein [Desulfonauticus submarinus]SDN70479.1 Murein DD-endopeptidase MepM and murein hydrolase activator NlpD, contain LysM domain [Desulfonauticus submarinus]
MQIYTQNFSKGNMYSKLSRVNKRFGIILFFLCFVLGFIVYLGYDNSEIKASVSSSKVRSYFPFKNIFRPKINIQEATIQPGDTIVEILSEYLSSFEIYSLLHKAEKIYPLNKIVVGHKYKLIFVQDRLRALEYEIDDKNVLGVVISSQGEYKVYVKKIHYNIKKVLVAGQIEGSLFEAVQSCGEKSSLAINLANIFGWDIDFLRDIRTGDRFYVLVEKRFRHGEFVGYGHILAARFVNKGKSFYAFLYKGKDGRYDYFDLEGKSLRKTFLKAPLSFTRISSGYSLHRYHPILHVIRPHRGIDYAAPLGTPIKTVADGIIIAKGRTKAAGNYVKIRHKNGYETIYNHMCRFAKGIRKGKRVYQGQVIGYVGQTGYATGPHLDFRMKRYGRFINPLKVKSDFAYPIPKKEISDYKLYISQYLSILSPQYAKSTSNNEITP